MARTENEKCRSRQGYPVTGKFFDKRDKGIVYPVAGSLRRSLSSLLRVCKSSRPIGVRRV